MKKTKKQSVLKLLLFFLLIIITLDAKSLQSDILMKPCTIQITQPMDKEIDEYFFMKLKLRIGEKLCIIHNPGVYSRKTGNKIALNPTTEIYINKVWQEYNVTRTNNFTIPEVKVICNCQCPESDKSKMAEDECEKVERTYKHAKCLMRWFYEEAINCKDYNNPANLSCAVIAYNDRTSYDQNFYQAMWVSSPPLMIYEIIVIEKNNGGVVEKFYKLQMKGNLDIEDRGYLNTGSYFIELKANTKNNHFNSQWMYVSPISSRIFIGVHFNDEGQFDLIKPGWFQSDGFGSIRTMSKLIPGALSTKVSDCKANNYSSEFRGTCWNKPGRNEFDLGGTLLSNEYRYLVSGAVFENGKLIIDPKDPLPVIVSVRTSDNETDSMVFSMKNPFSVDVPTVRSELKPVEDYTNSFHSEIWRIYIANDVDSKSYRTEVEEEKCYNLYLLTAVGFIAVVVVLRLMSWNSKRLASLVLLHEKQLQFSDPELIDLPARKLIYK